MDKRQRPEPDVVVVRADAESNEAQTAYYAEGLVLAIEMMSPDSGIRDRERKPQLYARAAIKHFWRVEEDDARMVVHVYELDPATHSYALTGIHHDRLKLGVPFDIDIDLTEIARL